MKPRTILLGFGLVVLCRFPLYADDWYRSVPDSTGDSKGWDCSLALDSQGNPHIAYYDDDYHDLRYASYDGTEWTVTVVDSNEWVGQYCSLALDANDRPHISYQKGTFAAVDVGLKYATLHDTGWAKIFVESEDAGAPDLYTSIAISPDGYPCISYRDIPGEYLKFAYADADGWHFKKITELPDTYLTKLQFMSDGRPVIGFIGQSDDQSAAIFKFAVGEQDYKTWHIQQRAVPLFFLPFYHWTDFVLDSQDHYHLIYLGTDFHLYYDYFDGSTWASKDLYDFYPSTATIAIDNNDVPHIVMAGSDLFYYSLVGDQWQEELIDDLIKPDYSSSLAFDSYNNPHIAIQGTPHASTKGQSMMYYSYVTGNPQILLPVTSHDYGDVFSGSFLDWDCRIKNVGNAPLTITDISLNSPYFDTPSVAVPFTIPPGDSGAVTVRFSPAAAQVCQADLAIHSNDPATPTAAVSLTGHGVSTGDVGDLSVEVTDVFFEDAYGTLNHEMPLDGAEISLYQGQQLIAGPVETDNNGQAALSDIPTGDYTLKIADQITLQDGITGKTLNKHRNITIGPGANSYTVAVPESLVVQTYASVYALTHLETNKFSISHTFTFGKSETGVMNTLDTWNGDLDDDVELYISRLLLTESMVNELFNDGFSIGIEATHDMGDLISFIFFSDEWVKKLIKILIDLIKAMEPGGSRAMLNDLLQMLFEEALKYAVLQMVTDGVEMAAAEVPSPGEEMINAIWRDVREEYCGFPDLSLNPSNWNHVKSLVYDMIKITFFQNVYVDQLTGPSIEQAEKYASRRQINGDLVEAFAKKISFVSNRKNDIEVTGDVAYALRTSANLLMLTTATLDWVATLDPTGVAGEIASRASFYMKGAAYVNVANALGMSVYQFFITPGKIDHTVDRIFFPDGKPEDLAWSLPSGSSYIKHPVTLRNSALAKMSASTHQLLAKKLESSAAAYDSLLTEIKNGLEAGSHLQSVAKLEQLMKADHQLQQSMRESRTPIQAVAAQADTVIGSFPAMYDSLMAYNARAAQERFNTYFTVFSLGLDSSSTAQANVISQLTRTSLQQQVMVNQLSTTLDSVVNRLEIPAIITASSSGQNQNSLQMDETSVIEIRLLNTGSVAGENISVRLRTAEGLSVETADSLFIGTLDPGEQSGPLSWTVRAADPDYARAVWSAEIRSTNAVSYPASGMISFTQEAETPDTGGSLEDDNIYCYPNPFNPDQTNVNLRYSLENSGTVTIRIYDAGGNLVKTVLDGIDQAAGTEQSVAWDGRNGAGDPVANGVYFFVIESSGNEHAVGKIAVLR